MSNNKVDNFETVYTTMVLLFLELGADEMILDMLRLALEIQVCYLLLLCGFDLFASCLVFLYCIVFVFYQQPNTVTQQRKQ